MNCPCGLQKNYANCCEPFHLGLLVAKNPEELMRSRFSAFVRENADYLLRTLHPDFHQPDEKSALLKSLKQTKWLSLRVLNSAIDPQNPHQGHVEFLAFYQANPVAQLHEKSQFILENEQWYYTKGKQLEAIKLQRNDICWCGSLKKLKKCHP